MCCSGVQGKLQEEHLTDEKNFWMVKSQRTGSSQEANKGEAPQMPLRCFIYIWHFQSLNSCREITIHEGETGSRPSVLETLSHKESIASWTSGHWVISWVYRRQHMVLVLTDRSGRFCHHEIWSHMKSPGLFIVLVHGEYLEVFRLDTLAISVPCSCSHPTTTVPCPLISFPTHLQVHIRKLEEAHLLRLYLYEVSLPLLGEILLLPLSFLRPSFILSFKFGGNQLEFQEHPQEKNNKSMLVTQLHQIFVVVFEKADSF